VESIAFDPAANRVPQGESKGALQADAATKTKISSTRVGVPAVRQPELHAVVTVEQKPAKDSTRKSVLKDEVPPLTHAGPGNVSDTRPAIDFFGATEDAEDGGRNHQTTASNGQSPGESRKASIRVMNISKFDHWPLYAPPQSVSETNSSRRTSTTAAGTDKQDEP
jgi:hypothetical protein